MDGKPVFAIMLTLAACAQPTPSQPDQAPSASASAAPADPEREPIRPDPERAWRTAVAPKPVARQMTDEEYVEAHRVPQFQIETVRHCPTCYGFGGTVAALTPSRKSAEQHAVALRALVAHYKGGEWNRHLTTVPWFGEGRYALIYANTFEGPANQMCEWLTRIGWGYGDGIPGTRECKVYATWPPAKP